jgi:hypothetical protein
LHDVAVCCLHDSCGRTASGAGCFKSAFCDQVAMCAAVVVQVQAPPGSAPMAKLETVATTASQATVDQHAWSARLVTTLLEVLRPQQSARPAARDSPLLLPAQRARMTAQVSALCLLRHMGLDISVLWLQQTVWQRLLPCAACGPCRATTGLTRQSGNHVPCAFTRLLYACSNQP